MIYHQLSALKKTSPLYVIFCTLLCSLLFIFFHSLRQLAASIHNLTKGINRSSANAMCTCACTYTSAPTRARKRDALRIYLKHPDKKKRKGIRWSSVSFGYTMNTGMVELKIEPVLLQKIQICVLHLSRLSAFLSLILFLSYDKAAHFKMSGSQIQIKRLPRHWKNTSQYLLGNICLQRNITIMWSLSTQQ